jgi:hypothetical protein
MPLRNPDAQRQLQLAQVARLARVLQGLGHWLRKPVHGAIGAQLQQQSITFLVIALITYAPDTAAIVF